VRRGKHKSKVGQANGKGILSYKYVKLSVPSNPPSGCWIMKEAGNFAGEQQPNQRFYVGA